MLDQTPQQAPAKNNSTLTKVLIGIITLLVLGVIALATILITKDSSDDPALSTNSGQSQSGIDNREESSDQEPAEPIATVPTETSGLDMELTGVHRNGNFLTLNFKYVYSGDADKATNPSFFAKLRKAYLVEGTSGQKYEVVVDANKEHLVSDIEKDPTLSFDNSEDKNVSFFITITAPPAGSNVDIYVPGAQPMTNIAIK